VDEGADLDMAVAVTVNAKTSRVSVCNSAETLLVHAAIAPRFLPAVSARLIEAGVEIRGDAGTRLLVPDARPAEDADWDTEYLDYIISVRVVPSFEEAVAHIQRHSTGVAETIVTSDLRRARRFTRAVDAGAVRDNASTRLVDGGQFGMGAEMGISTSKLHARGPVGVRELTTTKFIVLGDGHLRE
jgi:glutamate-5-semialdehyde dehydrogenase